MSTYTSSLGLELITPGSQAGLWGNTTNNSLTLIDQAVTGVTPVSFASASGSTHTLTDYNGAEDEARSAVLNVTGSATGANTIVIPNKQKTYLVRNSTGFDVNIKTLSGSAYVLGDGYNNLVFCDGNNGVFPGILAPGAGTVAVNGGGTGQTSFTAGFVKSPGGATALTTSATVSLASEVAGTLPVGNGGTGVTSFTSGGVLLGNGSGAISTVTASTVGNVLTWNGSTWQPQAPSSGGVTSISGTSPIVVTGTTTPTISLGVVPVANGGTGATTAATALSNLGGVSSSTLASYAALSGATFSGNLNAPNYYLNGGTGSFGFNLSGSGIYWDGSRGNFLYGGSSSGSWQTGSFTTINLGNSGTAYRGGATTWDATSDARLKTNINYINSKTSLDVISALKPVEFNWAYDSNKPKETGFLAQEFGEIFPGDVNDVAVSSIVNSSNYQAEKDFVENNFSADDSIKTIALRTDFYAHLVGAIKELKAEIDALKAAK